MGFFFLENWLTFKWDSNGIDFLFFSITFFYFLLGEKKNIIDTIEVNYVGFSSL